MQQANIIKSCITYPQVLFFMSHSDLQTFPSEPQTGPTPEIPFVPEVFTEPLPIIFDKMSDRLSCKYSSKNYGFSLQFKTTLLK